MRYVKVEKKYAQAIKLLLEKRKLLSTDAVVEHKNGLVYFPIATAKIGIKPAGIEIKVVNNATRGSSSRRVSARKPLNLVTKGYETLGNIAVFEFLGESAHEQRRIGLQLLSSNKHITTVLAKAGPVRGEFRIRKYRYIAGKRNFMADYRENNCRFVFDVRKTFFSARLSYERNRITSLVKPNESVVVMFAGVGPFAIQIAKAHPKACVVAIELNRRAYEYMLSNITLNKVQNVMPVCGDVKKVARKYRGSADRIIMPMPTSSYAFLDEALLVSKRRSIVHLYAFCNSEEVGQEAKQKLRLHAKHNRYAAKVLFSRAVAAYSAREVEAVTDYSITKGGD